MSKSRYGFSTLLSQEENKRLLLRDAQDGALSHALLFTGPTGSGRRSLAMALAAYLLCEDPGAEDACGICPSCRYVEGGTHPDLKELNSPDGKLIKVEMVRDAIIRDLPHMPQLSRCKVYILAADYLNEQGQNALLKSLEEPPAYAYFILTAESASELLPTIISRVREYKLQPLTESEMREVLKREGYTEGLDFLAAYGGHIPGRALALAAREDYAELRKTSLDLISTLADQSFLDLAAKSQRWLLDHKEEFADFLAIGQSYLRDLGLMIWQQKQHKQQADNLSLLNPDQKKRLQAQARLLSGPLEFLTDEALAELLDCVAQAEALLREAEEALNYNVNYEILTWNLLLGLKEYLRPVKIGKL
ncbi:MAG: hypothetical protein Q4E09_04415 [Eubacteriales bacterium]|nr:hypothetical protein [Eubacteriales bacterium]